MLSRSLPLALEVTGDHDNEESCDGRSGNELETGITGYDVGIDERPCEEGFFASLCLSISGKTEVMRELNKAGPCPLSNASRPSRPLGTLVQWERSVHRQRRAEMAFCIS
jgi:hypothetical protein